MSKTYEEVKRRFNDGTLNISIVPWVEPLLKKIEELEKDIEDMEYQAFQDRGDRDF